MGSVITELAFLPEFQITPIPLSSFVLFVSFVVKTSSSHSK